MSNVLQYIHTYLGTRIPNSVYSHYILILSFNLVIIEKGLNIFHLAVTYNLCDHGTIYHVFLFL